MTSEELADQVTSVVENLRARIIGTGNEQYSQGEKQKIELKSEKEIAQEALEEIEDLIVYSAVIHARLQGLVKKL
jgi:hypothetical protein